MIDSRPTVLHIHFWSDIRNTSSSVEKVITAFASHANGYRHLIACCPTDSSVPPTFGYRGVEVHTFRESRLANRVFNKILGLGAFTYRDLVRLIENVHPDVLHFHNRQGLVDDVVRRLSYRPAVLVHYHRHFEKPAIPRLADRLLFVSQYSVGHILGKTGSKVPGDVVFNPLSLELLERAGSAGSTTPGNKPPVILFAGGGNPIKGGKELLEAFATLPPGSARLQIAGGDADALPGLPCPGVEIIGRVPASRLFELMLAADMVAMPSYDESFGLVAQEAMLLRKLLLVSATGGLIEFTGDDCAVTVVPKDGPSLRAGLRRALALLRPEAREQREKMLARALERVAVFQPQHATITLERSYDAARCAASRAALSC